MSNNVLDSLTVFIKSLSVSKPIFTLSQDRGRVTASLKETVRQTIETSDPLELLVIYNYRESFSRDLGVFVISEQQILSDVGVHVKEKLQEFLYKYMANKKPNQTQLYKWLQYLDLRSSAATNGIFLLYKYLSLNTGPKQMQFANDSEHVKNGLLILEKLKEYDEKSK